MSRFGNNVRMPWFSLVALAVMVTNADYRACVQAGKCKPPAFEDPKSAANLKTGKEENAAAYRKVAGDDQPAIGVSWHDATAYCKWKGTKLARKKDVKPETRLWTADCKGCVAGASKEQPSARAPWLSFRCSPAR